jgi:hypothetical protein
MNAKTRTNRSANIFGITATCLMLLAGPSPLDAQVASSADSAAVLLEAAASFESSGEWDVAEALYRFIAAEFDTTPAGVEAQARSSTLNRSGAEGSGSVELRIWGTTFGLWLGMAVPTWLGANNPEPYGVGLLAGPPTGYFGGKALAESMNLTQGQARAITFGGTWGTFQGLGWAEVLDLGDYDCYQGYCYGSSTEAKFGAMVLGGLSGATAGALLARKEISRGTASAVSYGALWGSWFGYATSFLLDFDYGDARLASALVGGNAGLLSTALLAPGWNISRNRARLVSIAGVIGGVAGLGLDLIIQPDDERTAVAIPLATSIIGLVLGVTSTRDIVGTSASAASHDPSSSLSGALFKLDEGKFGIGFPMPTPTFLRRDLPSGGTTLEPAASFTLFAARF